MSHEPAHRLVHLEPASTDKASWRREIRAARQGLEAARRAELAEALCERALSALGERTSEDSNPAPRKVAAYFSSPGEPDTSVLLRRLVRSGFEVYLPVCEPRFQLSWTRWEEDTQLARSAVAPITEPVGERHGPELFADIELMFIPALAVDGAGMRLGQGGGYYDRFLPKLDGYGTRIAALVYDDEFVEAGSFEVDPHDRPVGAVITPSAVHRLDNGF